MSRLILLGMGAAESPLYAPSGLLLEYGHIRLGFDGGPGSEPPETVTSWFVRAEHGELYPELRRIARESEMPEPSVGSYEHGHLVVQPFFITPPADLAVHEDEPHDGSPGRLFGYRIAVGHKTAVWAPEFGAFPAWADGADLMFADATTWETEIRGHLPVARIAREARRHGVRRLVFAHVGDSSLEAMADERRPHYGEWGEEGRIYRL